MLDHEPITFKQFLGTFDRGEDDVVPQGFFRSSQNIRFSTKGVQTREGSQTLFTTVNPVKRIAIYKRIGEAARLLILDSAGNLFDSLSLGSPILAIPAMTDFSSVTLYNRAYITPHNGLTGLPGEKVYVYAGSGVARPAGGAAPTATPVSLSEPGTSGSCEAGVHLYGVAFETDTGFVSAPSCFASLNQTGGQTTRVSNIPVGPAGTVARHIVATKRIIGDFTGDFTNQTYYFVPNGRIGNNTSTSLDVSFYDADLLDDASFLLDQTGFIPAGVGIGTYSSRLIVWGEDANSSVIRVSKQGDPESISAIEGFVTVRPGDAGQGVKYCFAYRTQLIVCKSQRTYVTADNNNEGSFWEVDDIDLSKGCECHGCGKILDIGGEALEDRVFVASRDGLQIFGGTYSDTDITYNVQDIWSRINKAVFHKVEVAVDSVNNIVYIAVPLDGATLPNYLLVGDYNEGLNLDGTKWTLWAFPDNPNSVVVDVDNTTKESFMKFGGATNNVYGMDLTRTLDSGSAIDSWTEFPLLPESTDETIFHYTGVGVRVKGQGNLQIFGRGLDDVQTFQSQSLIVTPAPGHPLFRGMNFVGNALSVKLRMNLANEYFILNRFSLYVKPLWGTRPEVP